MKKIKKLFSDSITVALTILLASAGVALATVTISNNSVTSDSNYIIDTTVANPGPVSIGTSSATAINIGKAGVLTSILGSSTISGLLTASAGLTVTGSVSLGTPLATGSGGTGISTAPATTGQLLMASSTGWVVGNLIAGSNITITTSTTGQITFAATAGSGVSSSSPFSAGYIPFATSAAAITNSNLFQSGSNIGIGTTTPGSLFTVSGNGNITGSLTLGTPLATGSGGIGISTAPAATGQLLMASSTGWVVGNLVAGSNVTITTSTTGQITFAATSGISSSSPFSAGYIPMATSGTAISNSNIWDSSSTGNIGIGTTTPGSLLVVAGTSNFTGASTIGGLLTANAGLTANGGTISLASSTFANGGSGPVVIDTTGAISIGTSSATSITIGKSGQTVTFPGTASTTKLSINSPTVILGHLSATSSITFAVIASTTCAVQTMTLTGANTGDIITVTPTPVASGIDTVSSTWNGWVSATNTVSIRACNPTAANTASVAAQTWRADDWQH